MNILPLRFLGDPILRSRASPVEVFDETLRAFAEDLVASMYAHNGVGLAAPQVGRGVRVIAVDASEARDGREAFVLVNPEILEQEGTGTGEEGCLSIPGVTAEVERHTRVVVEGSTPEGEPRRIEASDFLARILQHEIDHLNGVLFIDRLGPLRKRMAIKAWKRRLAESESPAARGA
jgi:peptide deformylase